MSIEDVNFIKNNSKKQCYTFLIDSKDRDRNVYPHPNNYVINFTVPFKNVIGFEVIDASIPRTMYNIDTHNNVIYIYITRDDNDQYIRYGMRETVADKDGNEVSYLSLFQKVEIEPGDYTYTTFISAFNNKMDTLGIDLNIRAYSTPAELTNLLEFFSTSSLFILDMKRSTIFEILGFDLNIDPAESLKSINERKYRYIDYYKDKPEFEKMYHSTYNNTKEQNIIISPGIMYFMGHKYILLRCPEIEEHLYRSLSYAKYNLGLAKIRISSYGYNDEKIVITKIPIREFHPIGKLSRLSFRFETNDGSLYDFKGVNHNIVYAIYYYEPVQNEKFVSSILNPEYKMNYLEYMYKQEEQEGDSDDDEFSNEYFEEFAKKEFDYSENGIKLKR